MTKNSIYMCGLFIGVFALLIIFETFIVEIDKRFLLILYFTEVLYGLVSLFISYASIQADDSEFELRMLRHLYNQEKEQYALQKESMELINIKCHDIKHQIQMLKNKSIDNDLINEIEENVNIYNSKIKTENEVLDVLLSNLSLRCHKNNIQLTCMADGKSLSFMEESDVYSLFGNLLDNAFESELKCSPENRFISLTIQKKKDFIWIHEENYFDGELSFNNGVIQTTKKDTNYHGFGIKSMRRIVEKNEGTLDIKAEDKMFQLDILIPVTGDKNDEKE